MNKNRTPMPTSYLLLAFATQFPTFIRTLLVLLAILLIISL